MLFEMLENTVLYIYLSIKIIFVQDINYNSALAVNSIRACTHILADKPVRGHHLNVSVL